MPRSFMASAAVLAWVGVLMPSARAQGPSCYAAIDVPGTSFLSFCTPEGRCSELNSSYAENGGLYTDYGASPYCDGSTPSCCVFSNKEPVKTATEHRPASRNCGVAVADRLERSDSTTTFSIRNKRSLGRILGASNGNPFPVSTLSVRVGLTNSDDGSAPKHLTVTSATAYFGYRNVGSPGHPIGDAWLLMLTSPIDFDVHDSACTACLPDVESAAFPGNCHVAGYGATTSPDMTNNTQLYDLNVAIVPRDVCNFVYRQLLRGASYVTDGTSACVGGQYLRDKCQREDGAPLNCYDATVGYELVVGLSSWRFGCGLEGVPSVYTDLRNSAILNFIKSTAGPGYPPLPFGKAAP